jgi:hypothetical protein
MYVFGDRKYYVIHECVPYWLYQLIKLEFTVKMRYKVKRSNLAQIERAKIMELAFAVYWITKIETDFLISNFRHVQNGVCFFWVIPLRLNFICRRFGTLCSIFIGG